VSAAIAPDAATREPVLQTIGLSAGYGPVPVLHDLHLRVDPGTVVALLGPNGAGKTTLLLALSGVLPVMSGEVKISGTATKAPLFRRARSGMGFVSEDRSIFRSMTTTENLRVGSVNVDDAMDLFPELKTRLKVTAGLLSGGEQQMLTLARALARKPAVLLIDELSLGLAPLIVHRLLERISVSAHELGTGVLLVEQHVRKALAYADHAYVLNRGRIVMDGSGASMSGRIDQIEEAYLSGMVLKHADQEAAPVAAGDDGPEA
jgi:branched-chain amino acid transport system ATP-binding protein